MKACDMIRELEKLAPPSFAESWDNSGLLTGSPDRDIRAVYIALDADSKAIENAVLKQCDMIITHHPMIFSPLRTIRDDDFIGKRVIRLIENRINLYAMHTNFDAAVMGKLCAERLNIRFLKPLAPVCIPAEGDPENNGIGIVGIPETPVSLRDLSRAVKTAFDLPEVRYYGDPEKNITKIAMCPGSGKSLMDEVINECPDVYLTGDVDHHFALDMLEKGVAVIDAGHHGLEHVFVDYMMNYMRDHMPDIECYADENHSPFNVV